MYKYLSLLLIFHCYSEEPLRIKGAPHSSSIFKKSKTIHLDSRTPDALLGNIENILKFNKYYIILCSEMEKPIKVFTEKGDFFKNLSNVGPGPDEIKGNTVFGCSYENNFYLLDSFGSQIWVYDANFLLKKRLPLRKLSNGTFNYAIWMSAYQDKLALFDSGRDHEYGGFFYDTKTSKLIGPQTKITKEYKYRSGGVLFHNDLLYYIDANDPWLFVYNLNGELIKKVICAKPSWPIITSEYLLHTAGSELGKLNHKIWGKIYSEKRHINTIFPLGRYIMLDYVSFFILYDTRTGKFLPYNGLDQHLEGSFDSNLIAVEEDLNSEKNPNLTLFSLVKND